MTIVKHIQEHKILGLKSFASKLSVSEDLGGSGAGAVTNRWTLGVDGTFTAGASTGTATAGGATSVTLASSASITDDDYNGRVITITAGTGVGSTATITDYVGSTKVVTVASWSGTSPGNGSTYSIAGSVPTAADWEFNTGWGNFNPQTFADPICRFGYNAEVGSGRKSTSANSIALGFEADYYDPGKKCQVTEAYFEAYNRTGVTVVRPLFFQLANNEADAATVGFVTSALMHCGGVRGVNGIMFVAAVTGVTQTINVANIAKNTLSLYYDSGSGTPALSYQISVQGNTTIQYLGTTLQSSVSWFANPSGGNAASALLLGNSSSTLSNAQIFGVDCTLATDSVAGIRIKAKSSQTGNPFELQDSAAAILLSIARGGGVTVKEIAAPATPAANYNVLYFDSTAHTLCFKDSSGVVHTVTTT